MWGLPLKIEGCKYQDNGYGYCRNGPQDIEAVPDGLETLSGRRHQRVVAVNGLHRLQFVVEGHIDGDRRQLYSGDVEKVGREKEPHGQTVQLPEAEDGYGKEREDRPNPNKAEKWLAVLDDAIDYLECTDESTVIELADSGHDNDGEGEDEPGHQRSAEGGEAENEGECGLRDHGIAFSLKVSDRFLFCPCMSRMGCGNKVPEVAGFPA